MNNKPRERVTVSGIRIRINSMIVRTALLVKLGLYVSQSGYTFPVTLRGSLTAGEPNQSDGSLSEIGFFNGGIEVTPISLLSPN